MQKPGYLAFLGRIAPEKSVDRAIRIAVEAGLPLKIAAKVDRVDRDYFERDIRPMLDLPGIEYIGEIDDAQKSAFLGGALALLMPIDWPEPFGLVMIEAMACGTPVIAFRSGSVPEVVEHGVTGLIVDSEAAAVAAIRNRARAAVAPAHPRPLRGALHRAPHGRGISRHLSRPDRRQPAPAPENGQRRQARRSTYRRPSSNWNGSWAICSGLSCFRRCREWLIREARAESA